MLHIVWSVGDDCFSAFCTRFSPFYRVVSGVEEEQIEKIKSKKHTLFGISTKLMYLCNHQTNVLQNVPKIFNYIFICICM